MKALIAVNAVAWFGAALLLCGSIMRLLVGRSRASDDVLSALSLISALIGMFFARRLVEVGDQETFTVLCVLSLLLAVYVYRLGWGRGNGC